MKSIRAKLKNLKKPISGADKISTLAEKRHIQAHLAVTELRLRIRSVRGQVGHSKRAVVLDILHDYWRNGVFPKNTYKIDERTPVFIDEDGVHCAVGYLMAQTGYVGLARQINDSNKLVLVEQLDNPKAELWLKEYGFTKDEAALVQPGYGGFIIERVSYSLQDKLLGVISLIACLMLLATTILALRVLRSTTLSKPQKRTHILKLACALVVIVAGFIVYLPTPKQAVAALTSGSVSNETVTCRGWNTSEDKKPSVCREFERRGSLPGWQVVPCEEICIL